MAEKETVYYLEAANGMTVRVPESKLESWSAEQKKLKAEMAEGKQPRPDPKMVEALLSKIQSKQ